MCESYLNSIQNKRQVNEDRVLSISLFDNKLELCFVIDGCGAANGVGDIVKNQIKKNLPIAAELSLTQLEALFIDINNYIYDYRKYSNIGYYVGTLAAIDRENHCVKIAHVGDIRAYFLHNNSIKKLTKDHSAVGELEDHGLITENEAKCHPHRHMITKYCGKEIHFVGDDFVFLTEVPYANNDRLIIMTDGVYDPLSLDDILKILDKSANPKTCVEELFKKAIEQCSTDNATAAVYFF